MGLAKYANLVSMDKMAAGPDTVQYSSDSKQGVVHASVCINGAEVEMSESFRFLF